MNENTTTTAPALVAELVDVGLLDPAPWNPRIVDESAQDFIDLRDDVARRGVDTPILVRPSPEKPGRFQIIAGERRWRASRAAGRDRIPAVVKGLDDEGAMLATFAENFFREELSPLEQARGVRVLIEKHGRDFAAVADRVGKSATWVARRAQLLELSKAWQDHLAYGPQQPHAVDLRGWGVGHLELVARLPHEVQDRLLEHWTHGWHAVVGWTQEQLTDDLARRLRDLAHVGWDLDDAGLPGGACRACHKRSDAQAQLFEELRGADHCLDAECFKAKSLAFATAEVKRQQEKHGASLVVLSDRSTSEAPFPVKPQYQYEKAKKSDPAAVPALRFSPESGLTKKIEWVKPAAGTSAAAAAERRAEAAAAADDPAAAQAAVEEKLRSLRSLRWRHVAGELAEPVQRGRIAPRDLVAAAGLALLAGLHEVPSYEAGRALVVGALLAGTAEDVHRALCQRLEERVSTLLKRLSRTLDEVQLRLVLRLLGEDEASWWQAAVQAKPAPKALAQVDDQALPPLPEVAAPAPAADAAGRQEEDEAAAARAEDPNAYASWDEIQAEDAYDPRDPEERNAEDRDLHDRDDEGRLIGEPYDEDEDDEDLGDEDTAGDEEEAAPAAAAAPVAAARRAGWAVPAHRIVAERDAEAYALHPVQAWLGVDGAEVADAAQAVSARVGVPTQPGGTAELDLLASDPPKDLAGFLAQLVLPSAEADRVDLETIRAYLAKQSPRSVANVARGTRLKRDRVLALIAVAEDLSLSTAADGVPMVGLVVEGG